jgi:hypothetical protein
MYHGYARIWDLWMYEYNIYAHNPVERSKKVIEGEMMTKETKRNKKTRPIISQLPSAPLP